MLIDQYLHLNDVKLNDKVFFIPLLRRKSSSELHPEETAVGSQYHPY
jgi:hypothetical protein